MNVGVCVELYARAKQDEARVCSEGTRREECIEREKRDVHRMLCLPGGTLSCGRSHCPRFDGFTPSQLSEYL